VRHFNIRNKDVGLVCEYGFERFSSVARFGDDGDVAFDFEQGSEPRTIP
jgi:hypothetical protein